MAAILSRGDELFNLLTILPKLFKALIISYLWCFPWSISHVLCTQLCSALFGCDYKIGQLHTCFSSSDVIQRGDVIKWNPLLRYWPFVQGVHRSPMNFANKGQWLRDLICSLICARTNGGINNRGDGDLRHHCAHHDVTVMFYVNPIQHSKACAVGILRWCFVCRHMPIYVV